MGDCFKNLLVRHWHLLFSFTVIFTVTIGRIAYSLSSGFITPDEAFYFQYWQFYKILYFLFMTIVKTVFFVDNIYEAIIIITSVTSLFSIGVLTIVDRLLFLVEVKEYVRKYVVVSFCFAVTFLMNVSLWVMEVIGILFVFLGIFFVIRSVKNNRFRDSIFSVVAFTFAYLFRIEYVFFLFGNCFMMLILWRKRLVAFKYFVVFLVPTVVIFNPSNLFIPSLSIVAFQVIAPFIGSYRVPPIVGGEPTFLPDNPNIVIVEFNPFVTGVFARIYSATKIFLTGVNLGLNPVLFALVIVGLYLFLRNLKKESAQTKLLYANGIIGLLGFLFVSAFMSVFRLASQFMMTSAIIRYAYISLPSLLLINKVFGKLNRKQVFSTFVVMVMVIGVFSQYWIYAVQSNLSVIPMNRLSLNYKTPWLALKEYTVNTGRTLIIAEPVIRVQLFKNDNVEIYSWLVGEEKIVEALNGDWDTMLIYGELHYAHEITLREHYFWLYEIIENSPKEVVWKNEESYLYKLNR